MAESVGALSRLSEGTVVRFGMRVPVNARAEVLQALDQEAQVWIEWVMEMVNREKEGEET